MPSFRALRSWIVPGGLVVAVLVGWLALGPDDELLATATRGYPWVVYGMGVLLAWRFRRSRVAAALLVVALADRGIPLLAGGHTAMATDAAAYLVPLTLALLALLEDGTVFSTRGALQVGGVLTLVGAGVGTLFFRPDGVASFLDMALTPRALLAWTSLPPMAVLAYLGSAGVVGFAAFWRPGPVEKAFLWTLLATGLGLGLGATSAVGSLWLMAGGLILTLSVVEASYAMAFHDELTGLPARRALRQTLDELGRTYTLAMVDVDRFKKFNDKHGHDVGDQVLCMVATRLDGVGGGGKAFRYGGEEFAVVFPGKTVSEARPFAESMRKDVAAATFVLRARDRPRREEKGAEKRGTGGGDQKLSVTVSVGLAEPRDRSAEPQEVLEAADQALYKAKKKGRNRVEG